jgi:hypothetical protein
MVDEEVFVETDSGELGLLLLQVSSTVEFKSSKLGDMILTTFLPFISLL